MSFSLLEPNKRPIRPTTPSEKEPSVSVSFSHKVSSSLVSELMTDPYGLPEATFRGTWRGPRGRNNPRNQCKFASLCGQYNWPPACGLAAAFADALAPQTGPQTRVASLWSVSFVHFHAYNSIIRTRAAAELAAAQVFRPRAPIMA